MPKRIEQTYCYHCMHKKEHGENLCPYCGSSNTNYLLDERYLPVHTILNSNYILGEVLGHGGFGVTYIARDTHLNTVVAIKELFWKKNNVRNGKMVEVDPTYQEAFEAMKDNVYKEAGILSSFSDQEKEHIVIVKDLFKENNTVYIVMEYLEGTTLKDYVARKGPLTTEETATLLQPVAEGLALVHSKKIYHKDLTPDNIMILNDGRIKIMDFGNAQADEVQTEKVIVAYKDSYAPPEQRDQKTYGPINEGTDLYSFAATAYYCLTGNTIPGTRDRLQGVPISPMPPSVPEKTQRAVYIALNLRNEKRYHSALKFIQDFTPPSPEDAQDGKPVKTFLIAGIMILLALLVAFGEYYFISRTSRTHGQRNAGRFDGASAEAFADLSDVEIGQLISPALGSYEIVSVSDTGIGLTIADPTDGEGSVARLARISSAGKFTCQLVNHNDGFYNILYEPTGYYIETESSQAAGTTLMQLSSDSSLGTAEYQFLYCGEDAQGVRVMIINAAGKVLSAAGGNAAEGSALVLAEEDTGFSDPSQIWYLLPLDR